MASPTIWQRFAAAFKRAQPINIDPRRAAFLELLRADDTLGTFAEVDPDTLVGVARGLVLEAWEGRYESAKARASEYNLRPDDVDLLTAAAFVAYSPVMAEALLARPNEASARELELLLADAGLRVTEERR